MTASETDRRLASEAEDRFGELFGSARGGTPGRPDPDPGTVWRNVADLKEGDLVDLAGDRYADPDNDDSLYECEYQVADEVNAEPDRVIVHFETTSVSFPPTHNVRVDADSLARHAEAN